MTEYISLQMHVCFVVFWSPPTTSSLETDRTFLVSALHKFVTYLLRH